MAVQHYFFCPPVSLKGLLEPVARKRARPVLRGPRRSNAPGLPDEIFFSIVQRKVLTPNDFTSLDQVEARLAAFERRYNETARPFRWKFTPADLEDLMARIERHEQKERNLQQPSDYDHQPAVSTLAA
jgi:hypothetical protein